MLRFGIDGSERLPGPRRTSLDVLLPTTLRPGSAVLLLTDPANGDRADRSLVIP